MIRHVWWSRFLAVTAVLALALVIVLSVKTADLGRRYDEARRRANYLYSGSVVPPYPVETLAGGSITLGATGPGARRQVLLVFTTTCPYCRVTLPVWQALHDSLGQAAPGVSVIGVALGDSAAVRAYVEEHRLAFPIVLVNDPRFVALYKARAVPQTLVLEPDGWVAYATVGALLPGPRLDSVYQAALAPVIGSPGRPEGPPGRTGGR